MAAREDVLTRTYDLLLYLIPQLDKFPRSQKFLLGDRIETKVLDILEHLLEAYYGPKETKPAILRKVNLELEKLRFLVRLSHDLHLINHDRYGLVSAKVNEVGRMVGGWLKANP